MSGLVRSLSLSLLFFASPALAQVAPTYNPEEIEVIQQGTAFATFLEPGAPTVDVLLVNLGGGPSSLFRVGENTTLTQVLALSGAVQGTEENERFIIRSTINLLRDDGSGRLSVIYTAAPEEIFREPGQHPQLRTGDVIEIDNTYERVPQKLTFREGVQITASILSLVSTVVLIAIRL